MKTTGRPTAGQEEKRASYLTPKTPCLWCNGHTGPWEAFVLSLVVDCAFIDKHVYVHSHALGAVAFVRSLVC